MSPRLVGALLVLAVVAVAISAPAIGGRRTAGVAVMVDVPRDPVVGDCLAALPAEFSTPVDHTNPETPTTGSTTGPAPVRQPAAYPLGPVFAACDGRPAAGEVVSVMAADIDPDTRQLRSPVGADCHSAALRYAGLLPVERRFTLPGATDSDPVSWNFSIDLRSALVFPTALMQAQGRTWAACVIAPREDVQYTGRVADAFAGGALPDAFGTCWDNRSVSASVQHVDCRAPHLAELVAAGLVPDQSEVSSADLKASCERLAGQVLGRNDPTAGDRLVVKTSPEKFDHVGQSRSISLLCYLVTTGQPLDATLVGLRDRPIPFA